METRWLRVLVDLAELGTLRAVAASTGYSTSAVSQQLARLQAELGQAIVEPVGRRLELTPAGRAFLPHARAVLGELEAARGRLADDGPLEGTVRVAGYATSILRHIAPAVRALRAEHPGVDVRMEEREPGEIRALLAADAIDIGVVYDHSLLPRGGSRPPYAESPMLLAVHPGDRREGAVIIADPGTAWIANSRATDDDEIIARLVAPTGLVPRIDHHIDSIQLVTQLVADGHGSALVAADAAGHEGVRYVELGGLAGTRRSFTVTRPGREAWREIAALIAFIREAADRVTAR